MNLFRTAAVAALLCLGLAGCMPRATPVVAAPDFEAAARNFAMPPVDRARLYIASGVTPSGTLFGPGYEMHGISGDIYVDGVKIGSLNPKEIMVVDVVPGNHVLYWHYLNQSGGPLLRSDRLALDAQGGAIQMLGTNMGAFNLMVAQGKLYTPSNPSPMTVPAMFKIVRPSSCPPTICP